MFQAGRRDRDGGGDGRRHGRGHDDEDGHRDERRHRMRRRDDYDDYDDRRGGDDDDRRRSPPGRSYSRRIQNADEDTTESTTGTNERLATRIRDHIRLEDGSLAKKSRRTDAIVARVRRVFSRHAKSSSDRVNLSEFITVCRELVGAEVPDKDIEELFHTVDKDGSGAVDKDEFAAFLSYDAPELREIARLVRDRIKQRHASQDSWDALFSSVCGKDRDIDTGELLELVRALGVVLSKGEAGTLLKFLDTSGDGQVSIDEFRRWLHAEVESLWEGEGGDDGPMAADGLDPQAYVVDVGMAVSEEEAAAFQTAGYIKLEPSLNKGNWGSSLHLWLLQRNESDDGETRSSIRSRRLIDVVVHGKARHSGLVADGFERLPYSANHGNLIGRSEYIWVRRNDKRPTANNAITDLAVVIAGNAPPGREYVPVDGDLNAMTVGKSLRLWYKKAAIGAVNTYTLVDDRSQPELLRLLESSLRLRLRAKMAAPTTAGAGAGAGAGTGGAGAGARHGLEFTQVFREIAGLGPSDTIHSSTSITRAQFASYLENQLKITIPKSDMNKLLARINSNKDGQVSFKEFSDFVALDPSQLQFKSHEICEALQNEQDKGLSWTQVFGLYRGGASIVGAAGSAARRKRHRQDGVLSTDFDNTLTKLNIRLTDQESHFMLREFGFGADGFLPFAQLDDMLLRHRARRRRVTEAATKARAYLNAEASKSPLAGGLNFKAAWQALEPARHSGVPVIDVDTMHRLLANAGVTIVPAAVASGPVLMDPMADSNVLPSDEVAHVMLRVAESAVLPDPVITFSEFRNFVSREEAAADEAINRLATLVREEQLHPQVFFEAMDQDQSGCIAPAELRRFLNDHSRGEASPVWTHKEVSALIRRFDKDGDGSLNLKEFLGFLRDFVPEMVKFSIARASAMPIIRLFLSRSTDREAEYAERQYKVVSGTVMEVKGEAPVRLWAEQASFDGASPPRDLREMGGLLAIVVVPPSPSRAVLDELRDYDFEPLPTPAFPSRHSLWGVEIDPRRPPSRRSSRSSSSRSRDTPLPVSRLALTHVSLKPPPKDADQDKAAAAGGDKDKDKDKGKGGNKPRSSPSKKPRAMKHESPGAGWWFAGSWNSTPDKSTALWYFGGTQFELKHLSTRSVTITVGSTGGSGSGKGSGGGGGGGGKGREKVKDAPPTASTAVDAAAAPAPGSAGRDWGSGSPPTIEVDVLEGKHVAKAGRFRDVLCEGIVLRNADDKPCSVTESTGYASHGGVAPVWRKRHADSRLVLRLDKLSGAAGQSPTAVAARGFKLELSLVGKLDASSRGLAITPATGKKSSGGTKKADTATLAVASLDLSWHTRNPDRPRTQWLDLFDTMGLPAGTLRVAVRYLPADAGDDFDNGRPGRRGRRGQRAGSRSRSRSRGPGRRGRSRRHADNLWSGGDDSDRSDDYRRSGSSRRAASLYVKPTQLRHAADMFRSSRGADRALVRVWLTVDDRRVGDVFKVQLGSAQSRSRSGHGRRPRRRRNRNRNRGNRSRSRSGHHRRRRNRWSDDDDDDDDGGDDDWDDDDDDDDEYYSDGDEYSDDYSDGDGDGDEWGDGGRRGGRRRGNGRPIKLTLDRRYSMDDCDILFAIHDGSSSSSSSSSSRPPEVGRALIPFRDALRRSESNRGTMWIPVTSDSSYGSRDPELGLKLSSSSSSPSSGSAGGRFGNGSRRAAGSGTHSHARRVLHRVARQLADIPGGLSSVATVLHNAADRNERRGGEVGHVTAQDISKALRRQGVEVASKDLRGLLAWVLQRASHRGAASKPLDWSASDTEESGAEEDVYPDTEVEYRHLHRLLSLAADTSLDIDSSRPHISHPALAAIIRGLRRASATTPPVNFEEALALYDVDGNGRISVDDLYAFFRRLGCDVSPDDVRPAMGALEVQVDGFSKIQWRQFIERTRKFLPGTGLSPAEALLRQRVRESAWFASNYLDVRKPFADADTNGSGVLSPAEFRAAIDRLGVSMSAREVNSLMQRLDTNMDGTIDYYEFVKLIDLEPSEVAALGTKLAAFMSLMGRTTSGGPIESFRLLDPTQTGSITGAEFKSTLSASDWPLATVDIVLLARHFSVGPTAPGRVDYHRFLQFAVTGMDPGSRYGPGAGGVAGGGLSAAAARTFDPANIHRWLATSSRSEREALADMMRSISGGGGIGGGTGGVDDIPVSRAASIVGMGSPRRGFGMVGGPSSASVAGEVVPGPTASVPAIAEALGVTTPVRNRPGGSPAGSPARSLPGSPSKGGLDPKRERYRTEGIWACPVCYYTQTKKWALTCNMCGSANPYADAVNEVSWMCVACSYGNRKGSSSCHMCGLPMAAPVGSPRSETAAAMRAVSPSRLSGAGFGGGVGGGGVGVGGVGGGGMAEAMPHPGVEDAANPLAHLMGTPRQPPRRGSVMSARGPGPAGFSSRPGSAGAGSARWAPGGSRGHPTPSPYVARSLDFASSGIRSGYGHPASEAPRDRWSADAHRGSLTRPSTARWGPRRSLTHTTSTPQPRRPWTSTAQQHPHSSSHHQPVRGRWTPAGGPASRWQR